MKLTGRWFPQIVDRDSGNLSISNIYHITKIVVLVSEPVRGRSRVTELPCFFYSLQKCSGRYCGLVLLTSTYDEVGWRLCIHPCLFVCLLAGLLYKLWTDLEEILQVGSQPPKDHSIKF